MQILRQRGQVEIVDDDQITARGANDQSVLVRRQPTSHQTGRVEHLLVNETLFCVAVDVPGKYRPIEAGRYQQAVFLAVVDVLYPIGVALQAANFGFQVSGIPQSNRAVIRAGGKHAIIEEPATKRKTDVLEL